MVPARFSATASMPRGRRVLVLFMVLGLVLAACGSAETTPTPSAQEPTAPTGGAPATSTPAATESPAATPESTPESTTIPASPSPEASPSPTAERQVNVYFIRDEKIAAAHRLVPGSPRPATEAIQALLAGPTEAEQAAGMSTAIPEGTTLNGITIEGGLATVDLSGDFESGGGSFLMLARLAQVVYTLTQFPTVEQVRFELDGQPVEVFSSEGIVLDQPVNRAAYEDLTPAILVETPAFGDTVSGPLQASGTANVFEATFQIEILDDAGNQLAHQVVTATSGSGMRGTFDVTIPFEVSEPGSGTVVAYELSAKDGSRINEVRIPVEFQP